MADGATETQTTQTETATDQPWHASIADETLKGAAAKYTSEAEFLKAAGYEADTGDWLSGIDESFKKAAEPYKTREDALKALTADWRADLPDDLKPVAERFNTKADAIKAIADLRKRESNAIRIPGKEAKPEEIAAYQKAMDIPAEPAGYLEGIERPEFLSDEQWKSEHTQGLLGRFAERMHAKGAPKAAVQEAIAFELEAEAAILKAQVEADKKYAEEADKTLRDEWGREFDKNTEFAKRAIHKLFGEHAEAAGKVEDKQGRYVLDNPVFRKAFAAIGREMGEGELGGAMTDAERSSLEDQIRAVRKGMEEATANHDSKRKNELYQQELALLAKQKGSQPIVGAQGRAA